VDRPVRRLVILLVVVGLLGVVGDRVARTLATHEAQRRLVAAGLTSPQVDVRGFPFLTQLLARQFDDVQVTSPSVKIGTGRAGQVSGTAHDVTVPSSGPPTVGSLTARGTIPYAEVVRQVHQVGLRLRAAGAGQVQLRRQVSVLGRTYAIVARGRVAANGDRLLVTPTSFALAGGGAVDQRLSDLIANRFTFSYRVRGLPEGVRIDQITAAPDGFLVSASGRDVRLTT
jgi:LmeA-like phospholipid-binding